MKKITITLIAAIAFGVTAFADPTVDSETIKSIQIALNAEGYICGEPDGIAGQKTNSALAQYCSENGLTWDGTLTDELVASFKRNEDETESEIEATQYDDKLQQIFANLTFSTTEEELRDWIKEYSLASTAQKWNSSKIKELTYKIAYEQRVAVQRYADYGDHLEVVFNANDGTFMYAEYTSDSKRAIYYNYGVYWDFREETPGSQWSGYYFENVMDFSKNGIEIVYDNGYSVKTNYYTCKDADEALKRVLF